MLDEDRRPGAEVLASLPVFPLANAVLLPGMVLPLNVFEPRYLELMDHVLERGGYLGIPLLQPGFEAHYEGRPEIEPVLGLGRLLSHQRLPDGRRFIRVEGLGRVRRLEELPPRAAFRELSVEILPEVEPTEMEPLEVLRAQLERIAGTLDDEDDEQMVQAVLRISDVRVMLYAVAAIMPMLGFFAHGQRASSGRPVALDLQQACLAAQDGDERLAVLVDCAAGICEALRESHRWPESLLN